MHNRVKPAVAVAGAMCTAIAFSIPASAELLPPLKPPGSAGTVLKTKTSGAEQSETGTPGDPDGTGAAAIRLLPETNEICFSITHENVRPTQIGHLHKAPRGQSTLVAAATLYNEPLGVASKIEGCVVSDAVTIADIAANPTLYYVAEHNDQFPSGALRGQFGD